MSTRRPTLEFVRTKVEDKPLSRTPSGTPIYTFHSEWFWRFIASNGKETARSSETYRNRVDCIRSAELTTGCYGIREGERLGLDVCYRRETSETVNLRWVK